MVHLNRIKQAYYYVRYHLSLGVNLVDFKIIYYENDR